MNYIPIVSFISCLCVSLERENRGTDRADLQLSLLTEILELLCICNWSDVLKNHFGFFFFVSVCVFFLRRPIESRRFVPSDEHIFVWWFFFPWWKQNANDYIFLCISFLGPLVILICPKSLECKCIQVWKSSMCNCNATTISTHINWWLTWFHTRQSIRQVNRIEKKKKDKIWRIFVEHTFLLLSIVEFQSNLE